MSCLDICRGVGGGCSEDAEVRIARKETWRKTKEKIHRCSEGALEVHRCERKMMQRIRLTVSRLFAMVNPKKKNSK